MPSKIQTQLLKPGDELSPVFVTAPRPSFGAPVYQSMPQPMDSIGRTSRGTTRRGFKPKKAPPGVPPANPIIEEVTKLPELEEVVISANLSWWQRFNLWLRKPSTRTQMKIGDFVLDYYANNYMPMPGMGRGGRLPRLSRGGGFNPSKQRGFLMNPPRTTRTWGLPDGFEEFIPPKRTPAPSNPRALEDYLVRTTPIRGVTILPMPILRPDPPPGYEYDPDDVPDLIAQPLPAPLPSRTTTRQPLETPLPSVVPSPRPAPTPLPSPNPSPVPSRTPLAAPKPSNLPGISSNPQRVPSSNVTRFPFAVTVPTNPTGPRDYLLKPTQRKPGLSTGPRGKPAPKPTPLPIMLGSPQPQPGTKADTKTRTGVPRADGTCECEKEEKKPKKKREPRVKCYSGSYRERRYSLSKVKRKEIPCQ